MEKLITAAVPAMAVILGISAFAAQPVSGEHDIAIAAHAETAEDAVKAAPAFVGIVSGKGEYTFAPDDKLTREEAAVILYRIAKYADTEMPAVKVDMTYSDNGEISDRAVAPVYSLKVSGFVSNSDGEKFNPNANYTVGETISSFVKLNEFIRK